MKKFVFPRIDIIGFNAENVLTASGDPALENWEKENEGAQTKVVQFSEFVDSAKFVF